MMLNTGMPAVTKRPSWMLSTWVAVPAIGALQHGVVEVALRLVERGLGLLIGRELLDRQIGIAEQLVQRGAELLLAQLGAAARR